MVRAAQCPVCAENGKSRITYIRNNALYIFYSGYDRKSRLYLDKLYITVRIRNAIFTF